MIAADPDTCRNLLSAFFDAEDAEDTARETRDEAKRDALRSGTWPAHVPHLVSRVPDVGCPICCLDIEVRTRIAARVRAHVAVDALRDSRRRGMRP